jgi:hypothetical protein
MFAAVAAIMRGYGIARSGQPEEGRMIISDGLQLALASIIVRWCVGVFEEGK